MTSTTDPPLAFATGQVMSAADALMWRADDDRRFRAQVCGIEVLDRCLMAQRSVNMFCF